MREWVLYLYRQRVCSLNIGMFSRIKSGKLIFCRGSGWFSDTGFGCCPSLSFLKIYIFQLVWFSDWATVLLSWDKEEGIWEHRLSFCLFLSSAPSNPLFYKFPNFLLCTFFCMPYSFSSERRCISYPYIWLAATCRDAEVRIGNPFTLTLSKAWPNNM